jgi:hypothetical protein
VSRRRLAALVLLASLYTGLNALKAVQVDDASYVCYARQIAARPLDPYGFALLWYQEPQPANEILAPPLFLYALAPAARVAGERPLLWHLALLPWCLLLVFTYHGLARRFAPGLELPLTASVVLSPAVLPSLNLMLDVPALALGLLAVRAFLGACDRGSLGRAVLAGLVAGAASQTKYTGFAAVGALLGAALVLRRPGLGLAAAAAAAQVFLAWEFLTALLYGQSHFACAVRAGGRPLHERMAMAPQLFSLLGGLAPATFLLGLVGLGARWRGLAGAAAAVLLAFALVAVLEGHFAGTARTSPRLFGPAEFFAWTFGLEELVFGAAGAGGAVVLGLVARRLLADPAADPDARRDTRLLLVWLLAEVAGYLVLSPFGAARRVLGVFCVSTLLCGRLIALRPGAAARPAVRAAVCGGALLGLAYFALDCRCGRVQELGAREAAAWVRARGGGRVWYAGHWGFQFYAEAEGMEPVVPRYRARPAYVPLPPPSRLCAGDWLVVPGGDVDRQRFDLPGGPAWPEPATLAFDDPVPLRTIPPFYVGPSPLGHREAPRLEVHIYRVPADFTPAWRENR